ncbi:ankyrin [Hypomontagnella monticulosa]|nr:ankyrin [Hypomontagnella monticulosa]
MADPLSISASIAGLVTLADIVFFRCMKYAKSMKNAADETQKLAKEINTLSGALHCLSRLAHSFDNEPISNSAFRMHHIDECNDTLLRMKKELDDFDKNSLRKRVLWPFSSRRVNELLEDITRHREIVSSALSATSMDVLLRSVARKEDVEKSASEIQSNIEKTREIASRIRRDNEREKILDFFLKHNPQESYEMSKKLRHPRTGLWLQRLPNFNSWISATNQKLWFTGIPGAGKTVLAGIIIESALAQCDDNVAAAFFYCDYKNENTQSPANILGALAYQIAIQKEEAYAILEQYFLDSCPSRGLPRSPDPGKLKEAIRNMSRLFDRIYLIVDGIDECGEFVEDVLDSICSISDHSDNVSTALLSRDEPIIRDLLETDFVCEQIAAHTEDITEYVTAEIEKRIQKKKLQIDDLKLKGEIMQGLIDGARGMFRWVACQLDHLELCESDKECREALQKLPPNLNETYLRILKRIPANKGPLVQLILNFIAFVWPTLTIEQLIEALSVPKTGTTLERSARVRKSSILQFCSSLIRESNDGRCFEFAHFSVQEFLQNESLLKGPFEQFLVSRSRSNRLMAIQCLRYVQLEGVSHRYINPNDEVVYMGTRHINYPLYNYAAYRWPRYARNEWADEEIVKLARKLFDIRKMATFISWSITLVACDTHEGEGPEQNIKIVRIINQITHEDFTPLHMACSLSLPVICSFLLKQGADARRVSPIGTPIQCATGLRLAVSGHSPSEYFAIPQCTHHSDIELTTSSNTQFQAETIRCLVKAGVKPHQMTSSYLRNSPLGYAIVASKYSGDFTIVTLLISEGVPLEEHNIEAFLDAVQFSDIEGEKREHSFELLIKALNSMIECSTLHRKLCSLAWEAAIEKGLNCALDPNFVDPSISLTPEEQKQQMIAAVLSGDIVNFTRSQKALCPNLPDVVDDRGMPLLHIALQGCYDDDRQIKMMEILLTAGCSFSQCDSDGWSPYHYWIVGGIRADELYVESMIKAFIDNGLTAKSQSARERNILHLSLYDGRCLSAFIKYDNPANIASALRMVDQDGYTPLTLALRDFHVELANLLFEQCREHPETWQSPISILLLATKADCESIFRALHSLETLQSSSGDEIPTPLHHLGPHASIDFVNYLKTLYPSACNTRTKGKIPLDIYLAQLLETLPNPRIKTPTLSPDVVTALCPPESEKGQRKLVWEYFVKETISSVRSRYKLEDYDDELKDLVEECITQVIVELVRLDCLKSYEEASQSPAFFLLLEHTEGKTNYIDDLWPITSDSIYTTLEQTGQWLEFQTSRLSLQMLQAAIRSNDVELVELLLGRGVSVHLPVEDYSALEVACGAQVTIEVFMLLLDHAEKERLDETNPASDGNGLIHRLAIPGATSKVTELLKRGVNPNLRLGIYPGTPALVYHIQKRCVESAIALLENGANPTLPDSYGFDACLTTAFRGFQSILKWIHESTTLLWKVDWTRLIDINFQIGPESVPIYGCNALHLASYSGSHDCLRFYLDHDIIPNVNITSTGMLTPLHFAALAGSVDAIKFLCRVGGNINAVTSVDRSPLHLAVLNRHLGAVEALLELGGDRKKDKHGMTPYLYARECEDQNIVEILSKNQYLSLPVADSIGHNSVTSRHAGSAKALETAIEAGNSELCEELRQAGCSLDIDIPDCNGCSPLLLAIRHTKLDIVEWLLAHGASTLKYGCPKDHDGLSPIHEILKSKDLTRAVPRFLTKYLADGGNMLDEPTNPVFTAADSGNFEGLRFLLEHIQQNSKHYASMVEECQTTAVHMAANRYSVDKATPLSAAVSNGDIEIVRYLLEKDAEINRLDGYWNAPIHIAAGSKTEERVEVIQTLIARGANLEPRNLIGWTPLMIASCHGALDMVEVLLKAGANLHASGFNYENTLHYSAHFPSTTIYQNKGMFTALFHLGLDPHLETSFGLSAIQSAMCRVDFAAVILNGNYEVHKANPFPWYLPMNALGHQMWILTKAFQLFWRKIPHSDLRRIANTEPIDCWSPLCRFASLGALVAVENLITLGADIEFEGCPEGTALMAACSAGRLESVIFLVRRGAALSYFGRDGFRTAVDRSKTPQSIIEWLLVTRFTDQPKIMDVSSDGSSTGSAVVRPWSGIRKAELVISGYLERCSDESSIDYWIFLMAEKKEWGGRVVPIVDRRKTVRPSNLIPREPVRIHPDGYETPRAIEPPVSIQVAEGRS